MHKQTDIPISVPFESSDQHKPSCFILVSIVSLPVPLETTDRRLRRRPDRFKQKGEIEFRR